MTTVVEPPAPFSSSALLQSARLVWRQRRFVLRITLVAFVAGIALAFLLPKRYEATARFLPPDKNSSMAAMMANMATGGGALGKLAVDSLNMKTPGALYIGILQSRTVADDLINRFDLRKVYRTRYYVEARKELTRNTSITEDRRSGIVTVSLVDKDPTRAAEMVRAYIAALNQVSVGLNTSAAHRERVFMEERLQEIKQQMDAAALDLSRFSSKNTAIDLPQQAKAMVESAAQLQGQLIAAESELKGVEQVYTGNNVRVRSVRARINELRSQLGALRGKDPYVSGSEGEADGLYPPIRKLPQLAVTYTDLYRRAKVLETVFEILTRQYELSKVQEAGEAPVVVVLDSPEVPELKTSPHRTLLILLMTILGCVAASAWLVARERWERIDDETPAKAFIQEIGSTIRGALRRKPLTVRQARP